MEKKVGVILLIINIIFLINFISAASIDNSLHLNIQTINSTGGIVTGTFVFAFNISTTSNCANVVYSNYSTLTTDSRGIVSPYLENVNLNFSDQYWLCYYRAGTLINASKIVRNPYSFTAKNVSLSGIISDSNLNTGIYNITSSWFKGLFNWIIKNDASRNYLSFNGSDLSFSETQLNTTIDNRISAIGGDNSSWNQSYANTLYSNIQWAYNQTTATFNLYNATWDNSWVNTWAYNHSSLANLQNVLNGTGIYNQGSGNESWNETFARSLFAPNTTAGIQYLINGTGLWLNQSLGIGTSTPSYALEINQNVNALNVSNFLFVNSTNVGMGTNNPTYGLHVLGSLNIFANTYDTGGGSRFEVNNGISGGTGGGISLTGGSGLSNGGNISITGGIGATGIPGYVIIQGGQKTSAGATYSPVLINPLGGKVGIGTGNPSNTLDVRGTGNFSGTIYINNATDLSTLSENASWNESGAYTLFYNKTANINTGIYNITSSWFFGLFNWIIKNDISRNYLSFNGSDLTFSETQLNTTIDNRVSLSGGDNSSWNQSYANTLYSNIQWAYNQTTATFNLYNATWDNSWVNTWAYNHSSLANLQNVLNGTGIYDTYNATYNANLGNASWNQSFANTLYALIGSAGNASWNESGAYTLFYNKTSNVNLGIYNLTTTTGRMGIGIDSPDYALEINKVTNALNVSNFLFVNSTNVGIGLVNPTYTLDVYGQVNLLASSDGTSGGGQINVNKGTASNDGGSVVIQSGSAYSAGGNVSIFSGQGTFGAMGNVHIYGVEGGLTGGSFGNVLLAYNGTNAGGKVGIGVGSPAYALEIGKSNLIGSSKSLNVSGLLYVNSTNVGIGTSKPNVTLHVVGTGIYTSGTDKGIISYGTNYDFYGGNSEAKNYFAGNTGIGTSNPSALLETAKATGTEVNLSGVLYINSSLGQAYMPMGVANSNLRIGSLELQAYALNNEWIGENIYYNSTNFVLRQTGSGSLLYFAGPEIQVRTFKPGTAGDALALNSVQMKINESGFVGFGKNIYFNIGQYTGATAVIDGNLGRAAFTSAISTGNSQTMQAYNSFGASPSPDSGQITDVNDVYISDDLEVDGTFYLTGGYTTIVSADVAENLQTIQSRKNALCELNKGTTCIINTTKDLEYGDVVCINPNYGQVIMKCNSSNSKLVAGVVSNTSVIQMGNDERYAYPIAVAGIVFTKVSNENGYIVPGDLLVSASKEGYAMKASEEYKTGTILGKAYDFCDYKYKECIIPMFVALG